MKMRVLTLAIAGGIMLSAPLASTAFAINMVDYNKCQLLSQDLKWDLMLVTEASAKYAVVWESTFPALRPVMNPPCPPPIPSAPPSERCSRIRPIMARTTIRWITITTVVIRYLSLGRAFYTRRALL